MLTVNGDLKVNTIDTLCHWSEQPSVIVGVAGFSKPFVTTTVPVRSFLKIPQHALQSVEKELQLCSFGAHGGRGCEIRERVLVRVGPVILERKRINRLGRCVRGRHHARARNAVVEQLGPQRGEGFGWRFRPGGGVFALVERHLHEAALRAARSVALGQC